MRKGRKKTHNPLQSKMQQRKRLSANEFCALWDEQADSLFGELRMTEIMMHGEYIFCEQPHAHAIKAKHCCWHAPVKRERSSK